MEPQYNEPQYNKVLSVTKYFLYPSNSKLYEKKTSIKWNLIIACYIIASDPSPFIILRFHCWCFTEQCPVSGPQTITFDLEQLGNLSFPIQIGSLAPCFSQVQSTGLLIIFLGAQPWISNITSLGRTLTTSYNRWDDKKETHG